MTRYRLSEYLRLKHLGLLPKPIEPGTVVPEPHQNQQGSNSSSNSNGIMDQNLPPLQLALQPSTSGTQPVQESHPLTTLCLDEPQNDGSSDPHGISGGLFAVSIQSKPLPDSIPETPLSKEVAPESPDQFSVQGHPVSDQMSRNVLAGSSMDVPMITGTSSASTTQQIVVKSNSQENSELAGDLEKRQDDEASSGDKMLKTALEETFSELNQNLEGLRENTSMRIDVFQRTAKNCQKIFQDQLNLHEKKINENRHRLNAVEENAAVGDQRLTEVQENAAVGEQRLNRVEDNATLAQQCLDQMKKSADRSNAEFKETKLTVADNCRRLKSVKIASRDHENRLEEVEESQDDYDRRLEKVEESQKDYERRLEGMKSNMSYNQKRLFDKLFEKKKAAIEAAAKTQIEKLVNEQLGPFKREMRVEFRKVKAELAESRDRNEAEMRRLKNKLEVLEQNQMNRLPLVVTRRNDSGAGSSSSSGSGSGENSGGSRRSVVRRRIFQGQRGVSARLNRPSVTDNSGTSGGSSPKLERQNDSNPNTTPEQTPSPAFTRASTPETSETEESEVERPKLLQARKRVRHVGKSKREKGKSIRSAKRRMSGSGNSASDTDDANVASAVKRPSPRGRPKGSKRARNAAAANAAVPAKRGRTRSQTEQRKRDGPRYALRNLDDDFVQTLN